MRCARLPGLAATMVLALAVLSGAALAQTVELKFSHWIPPKHPLHPDIVKWGESIAEASNGTLKLTVFPAQQLGKAKDHYDMARDGIADITFINPGYTPGRFPIIAAGELPFLITNAKKGSAAFDEWYRKYAAREMGDVKVCLVHLHDPGTIHAKRKVVRPSDLEGMKVRPAQGTMARFVNMLGGSSVQVSAPEAREALERGVADAITFPWNSILLFGIDKAVSYHMDAPFYVTTFAWVMNKDRYAGLSPEQQKVIDDHCTTEWALKVASGWADWEQEGRTKLMGMSGHTVYAIGAEDVEAWRKAAQPLREAWKKDVAELDVDGGQALAELKQILERYGSAY